MINSILLFTVLDYIVIMVHFLSCVVHDPQVNEASGTHDIFSFSLYLCSLHTCCKSCLNVMFNHGVELGTLSFQSI